METKERVILVGVQEDGAPDIRASLRELEELADTAGAETAGWIVQNLEQAHPGTYIGKGKIDELKKLAEETGANGIICDDELSPAQMKNLEDRLDMKVMDRTILILDIFAAHASTREGKVQVELAQARYRMTRLSGFGQAMSRLGGGIGTRGPGESRLETDRRRIRMRITSLKQELKEVVRQREVTRTLRQKNHLPVAAIVGYTNAGKSTLLNRLTDAGVLSEDKLFATLDPTTRALKLPAGETILLTDTVGFINKLPHHLVDAFRSTLEEARYADMIIHVVDYANPAFEQQMAVVYDTLRQLDALGKPVITLFNKCDLMPEGLFTRDPRADKSLPVSARTGDGLPELLRAMESILMDSRVLIERLYEFKDAGRIQQIRKYGNLLSEEYTDAGIRVRALVPKYLYGQLGSAEEGQ